MAYLEGRAGIEEAVLERDSPARYRLLLKTLYDAATLSVGADIAQPYVAQHGAWRVRRLVSPLHAPGHVHLHHIACLGYVDILEKDVLHYAATRGLALESDRIPVLSRHVAMAHRHIAHAAAHLAAYGHAPVAIVEVAVLYQDVLRGLVHPAVRS